MHTDLDLYKLAITTVTSVYKLTANFPSEEKFGLISQMRRAAVSIPSNISEGAARNSTKEFIRFLSIARGSTAELITQFEIAKNLEFMNIQDYENIVHELNRIKQMTNALQRNLLSRSI